MFDALTKGFREAQNRLSGLTELNEKNIQNALKEVRLSLLEADVELGVVRRFLSHIEQKAIGQTLQTRVRHQGETRRVSAGEHFVKLCHDELVAMMSHDIATIRYSNAASKPTGVMLVGLQGSGKTTSAAKLARWLEKQKKRPMLVAADMQRPAAVEQLKVLGERLQIPVFNIPGESPLEICRKAEAEAKKQGRDVILYDTAGRLAIDEPLMEELRAIRDAIKPENIYLVVDAMIGQDAVKTAKNFHETLEVTGVVLTKLDGDARGGAALSIKEATGVPVLFVGMGETTDKLEPFRAEGMASRVLGMGDVVSLMQDFEEVVDQKKAEEDAQRLLKGQFTLEDFLNQVRTIQKMGSLRDLVQKIPGLSGMLPPGAESQLDDGELKRIECIIQSMTRAERADPDILVREPTRVKRISKGSGYAETPIHELVQKFLFMRQMMTGMGQNAGMFGSIPGLQGLGMARNLRRAMKNGKLPEGMAGMPGAGAGFPGMGMPGMGFPGLGMPGMGGPGGGTETAGAPRVRALSKSEKNARKNLRKRERDARKKGKTKR